MKTFFVLALAVSVALGLSGCVAQAMKYERDELLKRGYPAEYADGYGDGFGSGYAAAGNPYAKTTKDVKRYLEDPKYKTGWDDGFSTGKGRYESIARASWPL